MENLIKSQKLPMWALESIGSHLANNVGHKIHKVSIKNNKLAVDFHDHEGKPYSKEYKAPKAAGQVLWHGMRAGEAVKGEHPLIAAFHNKQQDKFSAKISKAVEEYLELRKHFTLNLDMSQYHPGESH